MNSKKSLALRSAALAGACALSLISMAVSAADPVPMSGPKNLNDTTKPGIPGVRTCFWETGPYSGDPYYNTAWPDTNTIYWGAKFTIPEGAKLVMEGQFPRSRYTSYVSYDERGQPVETVADYLLEPLPGHTNTTRHGADRTSSKRSYQIEIKTGNVRDTSRPEGIYLEDGRTVKVMSAPQNGEGKQQVVILRIYTPDKGTGITGGVPLPSPVLTLADGKVLRGTAACQALNTTQRLAVSPDAFGMPAWRYRELLTTPGKPDTHPATRPATWYAQFDRKQFESIFTGVPTGDYSRKSEGFYPTTDNTYIRTFYNRKFGPVFVIRGKLPVTPKTMNGDKIMNVKDADMRYWSICSQKGAANTMVIKCLNDEEVVIDKDRNFVIAFSKAADRPRTAYPECGINWLPMPDDGDGMYDPDQGNTMIRNMLVNPNFKQTTREVQKPGDEKSVMGPYLPSSVYLTTSNFESSFNCRSPGVVAQIAKDTEEMDAAQQAAAKAK